jgi:hypothetical protein
MGFDEVKGKDKFFKVVFVLISIFSLIILKKLEGRL